MAQRAWGSLQAVDGPDHLKKTIPPDCRTDIVEVSKEREFWCHECNSRVTVSPDGQREYGHRRKCDHALERSNHWPGQKDPEA